MPFTSAPRPVATRTTSASTDPALPSAPSNRSVTPGSDTAISVARAPRWVAMPRRLNARSSSFDASASSIGIRCSSISTIVTSVPKWRKIEANSTPITPPPRIASRLGTSAISSRPVESTQAGPSMPVTGGRSDCEPVAITAERKVTSSPPSTAIVFGPVNSPRPFTMVMPLALTTPVMPFTSPSTMPCLFCCAWPKSSSGSLTRTPIWAKVSRASFSAWAVCTHVFVGMQPTVMQVPPTRACSIRTTLAPSCAARIAAGYPPGPPPRTATSHSIDSLLALGFARHPR